MGKGHIAVNNYIRDKARFADMINGHFLVADNLCCRNNLRR